jgi:hypothetical protein
VDPPVPLDPLLDALLPVVVAPPVAALLIGLPPVPPLVEEAIVVEELPIVAVVAPPAPVVPVVDRTLPVAEQAASATTIHGHAARANLTTPPR